MTSCRYSILPDTNIIRLMPGKCETVDIVLIVAVHWIDMDTTVSSNNLHFSIKDVGNLVALVSAFPKETDLEYSINSPKIELFKCAMIHLSLQSICLRVPPVTQGRRKYALQHASYAYLLVVQEFIEDFQADYAWINGKFSKRNAAIIKTNLAWTPPFQTWVSRAKI